MKRKNAFFVFILCCIVFIVFIVFVLYKFYGEENIICHKNGCFYIQIADTDKKRKKGLMFVKNISSNQGMFFIFPQENYYGFWMKNTLISLDIIWLDKNLKVVYINANTPICKSFKCLTYKPNQKAMYVLEVLSGTVEKLSIKIGDRFFKKN